MKYNFSYSNKPAHRFINEKVKWEHIFQLTFSDFNYSAGSFKGGHRKIDNWIGRNNIVILDIDEGMSLNVATDLLLGRDMKALLITTKSHGIDKNGVVCDRFRIILPMKSEFEGSVEEYKNKMRAIFKYFLDAPDPATKDPSRFFYGNAKQEHWYIHGSEISDWDDYVYKPKKRKLKAGGFEFSAKSIEEIRDAAFATGNHGRRNNALYGFVQDAKKIGIDPSKIEKEVIAINNSFDAPLEKEEVDILINYHLKK